MTDDAELRRTATKRLQAKQGFFSFLGVWIVASLVTTGIWWFTGAGDYFWPGWVIGGMGVALIFTGINAFGKWNTITEAKIDAEVRKLKGE